MRREKQYFLIAISAIILAVIIMVWSNPLRRPTEQIRENMLRLTPIGTSIEDVINLIERNDKWEISRLNHERGYSISHEIPNRGSGGTIVGEKSIELYLGYYYYQILFQTGVTVFYGFDKDSKLVDIAVLKERDAQFW